MRLRSAGQQAANEQARQEQAKLNSGGQWESGEPNRRKEKQGPVFDADVVNPKNPPSNDATKTPLSSLTTKTKTKTKVPYLNDSSKSTSKISLGVVFLVILVAFWMTLNQAPGHKSNRLTVAIGALFGKEQIA